MTYDTEKLYPAFVDEAEHWISAFGLKNWFIEVFSAKLPPEDLAATSDAPLDRRAQIALNVEWSSEPSEYLVRRSGFHEICEVLFSTLEEMAKRRSADEEDIRKEIHSLIRILENVLFLPHWEQENKKHGKR